MDLSASTTPAERALLFERSAEGYDVPEVDDRPEVEPEFAWLFDAYNELRTEAVYVTGGFGGGMRLAIPVTRVVEYLDQRGVVGGQRDFAVSVLVDVDARALTIEGEIAERRAKREKGKLGLDAVGRKSINRGR